MGEVWGGKIREALLVRMAIETGHGLYYFAACWPEILHAFGREYGYTPEDCRRLTMVDIHWRLERLRDEAEKMKSASGGAGRKSDFAAVDAEHGSLLERAKGLRAEDARKSWRLDKMKSAT